MTDARSAPSKQNAAWRLLWAVAAAAACVHGYAILQIVRFSPGVDFAHWYANAVWVAQRLDLAKLYASGHFPGAYALTDGAFYPQPLQYPPSLFLLFVPLTWLSYRAAFCLWVLYSVAAVWLAVFFCVRRLLPGGVSPRSVAFGMVCLVASFHPLIQDAYAGQTTAMVLSLHMAGLYLAFRGRWSAGIFFALGNLFKPQFHLLWLWLLLWRRWRICLAGWLVTLLVEGASFFWVGREAYVSFFELRKTYLQAGTLYDSVFSGSLMSVLSRLLDLPNHPSAVPWVLGAASVLGVGYLAWVLRLLRPYAGKSTPPWLAGYGLTCCGVLLLSPLVREHHLVVLLPALIWVWVNVSRKQTFGDLALFVVTVVLVSAQYATSRFQALQSGWLALLTAGRLSGILLMVFWLVRLETGFYNRENANRHTDPPYRP